MARVKACRLCGRRNAPGELFCEGCGTSLADVPAMDEGEVERLAAADADGDTAQAPPDRSADAGGHPQAGDGTVRDQPAGDCALLFPWGRVSVQGQLSIGREAGFSPISRQLDGYPTVSRQHAVVRVSDGRLTVLDLRSTNGTWVNGSRLESGEARPVGNGDRIGFSRTVEAQVQIGPAQDDC